MLAYPTQVSLPHKSILQTSSLSYPSYFLIPTSLCSDLAQSHLPDIVPDQDKPVRTHTNTQDVSLLTLSFGYYRKLLSAALTAGNIMLISMLPQMILARTHVADQRRRGRSVGGCSLDGSK